MLKGVLWGGRRVQALEVVVGAIVVGHLELEVADHGGSLGRTSRYANAINQRCIADFCNLLRHYDVIKTTHHHTPLKHSLLEQ